MRELHMLHVLQALFEYLFHHENNVRAVSVSSECCGLQYSSFSSENLNVMSYMLTSLA